MESESETYSWFAADFAKNAFMQKNYTGPGVAIAYILFTKVIGPRIMKDRKPMDLKLLILFYNSFLVVSNIYMCYRIIVDILIVTWPYRCDMRMSPPFKEQEKHFMEVWFGFFVKSIELLDTVFFVLRKKFNQISFLHVFHHAGVFLIVWYGLRHKLFVYIGMLVGAINCFIHVWMYSYYSLSALGPEVRKYLWWKRYLTSMQIGQFFIAGACMASTFLTGCEEFNWFYGVCLFCLLLVTALFINFYVKTYKKEKRN